MGYARSDRRWAIPGGPAGPSSGHRRRRKHTRVREGKERGRSLEEEYFTRRDRELIETQRRKAADAEELRRLSESLELSDVEVLAALRSEGLDSWLSTRPSDRLFKLARRAAQFRVSMAGEAERPALSEQILAEATAVAEASGGVLGLGAVSSPERRALKALAAALGRRGRDQPQSYIAGAIPLTRHPARTRIRGEPGTPSAASK